MDAITRDDVGATGPNGDDVRLYEYEGTEYASVTSILNILEEKGSHLQDWKDRNDGEGNSAYHEHLFWYSRHVGTLGHWHALSHLDPSLEWSDDEEQSKNELFRMTADEVRTDSPREVLYSILRGDKNKGGGTVKTWGEFYDKHPPYKNGEYYKNNVVERAADDISFFVDAQQRMWQKLGLDTESIIAVEKYLFDEKYQYAGQVDLVYEDDDGNIVVADLKSSSGCYAKHQIQGAAYAKAIENDDDFDIDEGVSSRTDSQVRPLPNEVDRLEVHRAHPRTGQFAVHTDTETKSIHTTKYWNDSYDELWQQFEDLAERFEYTK